MATKTKSLKPTFADTLRAERERLGLSQADLAKLLDMSFDAISNWEREKTTPPAITQEGALARLRLAKGK